MSVIENEAKLNENSLESEEKRSLIYNRVKRIIDILGSIIGIIILIPITLVVFIINFLDKENGPVFYVQKRIGKNGKSFKMYKFRTMVVKADLKLKKYLLENPEAAEEFATYKKLKKDPRVTKIGRFLRNTSIDEFPQFINVLKGEMSLVGPRLYLVREKAAMGKMYKTIIQVKPGLTGPWQTTGRSNLTFEDRMKLDDEYIKNLSLKNDLKIFFKTFTKVIQKDGAA